MSSFYASLNTLLVGFAILAFVTYWFSRKDPSTSIKRLPCPPTPSLLWGHELEAFVRPSGDFYTENINRYGPTYRIKAAGLQGNILILADPVGVAHVFNNVYNYPHSPVFRPLIERLIGRGLVWVEGKEEHRRMRRLINPAFSSDKIKLMEPVLYETAAKLQACISNQLDSQTDGATFDIIGLISAATLDIIGRVAFNHDFEMGSTPHAKRIMSSWRNQSDLGLQVSGFVAIIMLRLFPFITSLPLKAIQAQGETKTIVKELATSELIRRHCTDSDDHSLLSILLKANSDEKEPIYRDELLDHIATFVVAGNETTATSLVYTLWELARNPDKQDRLRTELMASPNPTYDELQKGFPYLDACCKEGLRLHPPSSHMERVAYDQDTIPLHYPVTLADGTQSNSLVINKGQLIYIPSISLNRLTCIWGDGHVFRPERWVEEPKENSTVKIEGWSNIFSFSDGPRNCIGYRLAIFEWKILMLTLIRNFVFHDTGAKIISRFSAILQPVVVGQESKGTQMPIRITAV